jgi:hypothetical protein
VVESVVIKIFYKCALAVKARPAQRAACREKPSA